MGSAQQAVLAFDVLAFDEAVHAPWRPPLEPVSVAGPAPVRPVRSLPARPGTSRSRVGRSPAPLGAPARRDPAGPGGRAPSSRVPAGRPVRGGCAPRPVRVGGPGRVRLTGRGRRLLTVLAMASAVGLAAVAGAVFDGDAGGLRLAGDSVVVVRAGDTLWDIASSVADGEDVRVVVDEIQRLNGLEGGDLVPGQTLRLP